MSDELYTELLVSVPQVLVERTREPRRRKRSSEAAATPLTPRADPTPPRDPNDPACWSWRRYAWPNGIDELRQMRLLRQWHQGRCGTCADVGELLIDHDHISGWVRGLLCDSCNRREGSARDPEDVFARWRACPSAAILGVRVVYESRYRGIAVPLPGKDVGPMYRPAHAPDKAAPWPPKPWLSLDPNDADPVDQMSHAELAAEVRRLRRKLAAVKEAVA